MDQHSKGEALRLDAERLAANGAGGDAIAMLKRGLETTPDFFNAWLTLSRLLYSEQRFGEALKAVRTAENHDPLGAQFGRIQQSMQARDFAAARSAAEGMLAICPGHPRAVYTLAHLATSQGDHESAVAILHNGLAIAPANPVLQRLRVGALEQSGAYARAVEAAQALTRLDESFEALWGLISLQLRYGLNDQALSSCVRATRLGLLDAARASALETVRGQILRILGRTADSIAAFQASLAQDPANASAWWGLADMKTYRFSASERASIIRLLERPDLDPGRKSLAAFALGKAHDDDGEPAAAIAFYARANALQPGPPFDAARFSAAVDRLTASFTPQALERQAAQPADSPVPVFIVGLPRSGSTLLEQILASHSQIDGTIEQPTLPALKRKAHRECVQRFTGDYLDHVGRLEPEALNELGGTYLEESLLFRTGGAAIFTDKLPHNFEHVGLIHKILPQAVVIDMRRNPMDCGLSLFKQHFTQGVEFSRRLSDIAAYYNGYLKIMDHWDTVLPGKVVHVQYEDLIRDPEPVITDILARIGVAFEPACLEFYTTKRAIRTASSEQVRQPLYDTGIGAWKRVETHLSELKDGLGEATLQRFARYL